MVLWRTGGMNEVRDLQLSKNAIFHMIMYLILNVQLSLSVFLQLLMLWITQIIYFNNV